MAIKIELRHFKFNDELVCGGEELFGVVVSTTEFDRVTCTNCQEKMMAINTVSGMLEILHPRQFRDKPFPCWICGENCQTMLYGLYLCVKHELVMHKYLKEAIRTQAEMIRNEEEDPYPDEDPDEDDDHSACPNCGVCLQCYSHDDHSTARQHTPLENPVNCTHRFTCKACDKCLYCEDHTDKCEI